MRRNKDKVGLGRDARQGNRRAEVWRVWAVVPPGHAWMAQLRKRWWRQGLVQWVGVKLVPEGGEAWVRELKFVRRV